MWVDLSDGRIIGVPLAWFPRLLNATPAQRAQVEPGSHRLHWETIDEDVSVAGLLAHDALRRFSASVTGPVPQLPPLPSPRPTGMARVSHTGLFLPLALGIRRRSGRRSGRLAGRCSGA